MKTITQRFLKKEITGKKILIDSNIIIYLTDSIHPYDGLSRVLFELLEQGEVQAVFSAISIVEVMNGPLKKGLKSIALQVRDYLLNFPNAHNQDINVDVVSTVGIDERISWPKLRAVDSLIIASGLINEVDLFVSNDMHFKKAIPANMIVTFDK